MKKCLLLIACLLLLALPALADETGSCGTGLTYTLSDDGVLTITGSGAIYSYHFNNCDWKSDIRTVILENGVTEIGDGAFAECGNLSAVTLPDSLQTISLEAFYGCSSLPKIEIPGSVISLGEKAFSKCDALTSITIPASVTMLGDNLCADCSALTSVTLNSTVDVDFHSLLYGCTQLTAIAVSSTHPSYKAQDNVVYSKDGKALVFCPTGRTGAFSVPDGASEIGHSALEGCAKLTSITVPASVISIGENAFASCTGITSATLNTKSEVIGFHSIFDNCSQLTSIQLSKENPSYSVQDNVVYSKDGKKLVFCPIGRSGSLTIPDGVTTITLNALRNCDKLTDVTLPEGVVKVEDWAFAECANLKTITLPKSLTTIGENAFDATVTLRVQAGSDAEKWAQENGYQTETYTPPTPTPVPTPTPTPTPTPSPTPEPSAEPAVSEEPTVTPVPTATTAGSVKYSLSEKTHTATVTGPKSKSAKTITIPASISVGDVEYKVTAIQSSAFKGMKKLTRVTIGKNVKTVGKNAFNGCAKLKTVTLGSRVETIGTAAFKGCKALTKITIPSKVKKIGASAFENCKKLKTITIKSAKLTSSKVGSKAFKGISASATIKCPKKQLASYQKWLPKKGVPATATIR